MPKAAFATLIVAALAARLALVASTFGSTDALLLMAYTHLAERFGLGPAYHYAAYLNHPPLSGLIMIWADQLGSRIGLEFPDAFRILQVAADVLSAALLYQLGKRIGRPREVTAFYFASPAAVMLSGFHCNADPTMITLLLAATWCATRAPATSGALFGASAGIKIAPLPLMPLFLFDLPWRRRVAFGIASAAVLAAIFIPAVATGGLTVLHNVFGYRGSGYEWGFCSLGYLSHSIEWARFYSHYGQFAVIAALVALFLRFYRHRPALPAMIGIALLTMNFFSPAFGVQYLVWPLAFLPFALPRLAAYALNAALSLFLFATYTIWSRGLPWWFADAATPNPLRPLVAQLAVPLWILYGWAIVVAVRQPRSELPPQQLAEAGTGN
jgi:hypothetical protein